MKNSFKHLGFFKELEEAAQARKQGELEMMKIEEQIISMESKITELCTVHPLNYSSIIDKLDEHALLIRRKEQFEKIISELFDEQK